LLWKPQLPVWNFNLISCVELFAIVLALHRPAAGNSRKTIALSNDQYTHTAATQSRQSREQSDPTQQQHAHVKRGCPARHLHPLPATLQLVRGAAWALTPGVDWN
jgi:hypothetical protein